MLQYSFEVEEAVLKWSAEKQKQATLQRERTLKRQAAQGSQPSQPSQPPPESEPLYENTSSLAEPPLYENPSDLVEQPLYQNAAMLLPQPATLSKPCTQKPKSDFVSVTVPNPLIANISNDILTPVPSTSNNGSSSSGTKRQNSKQDSNPNKIDLAWFEQEADPFDNLELQTINDMEVLANVLSETKIAVNVNADGGSKSDDAGAVGDVDSRQKDVGNSGDDESDENVYENLELRMMDLKARGSNSQSTNVVSNANDQTEVNKVFDIQKLPPVPKRRDLIGKGSPLPPIGGSGEKPASPVFVNNVNGNEVQTGRVNSSSPANVNSVESQESFQIYENVKPVISKKPEVSKKKPSRYSRHDLDDVGDADDPVYDNHTSVMMNQRNSSVQFTNSNPNSVAKCVSPQGSDHSELNFVNSHFAPESFENSKSVTGAEIENKQSPIPPPRPAKPSPVPPPRPDKPTPRPSSSQVSVAF